MDLHNANNNNDAPQVNDVNRNHNLDQRRRNRQREGHNNNNHNDNEADIQVLLVPWTKCVIVIMLLFLTAILQVTVWSLEVAYEQAKRKKSHRDRNQRANTNGRFGISPTTDVTGSYGIDAKAASVQQPHNHESPVTADRTDNAGTAITNTVTGENKKANEKQNELLQRGLDPIGYKDLYWYQQKFRTTHTGQSISNAANTYWDQVLQSGILDWEYQDSTPSIGASIEFMQKRNIINNIQREEALSSHADRHQRDDDYVSNHDNSHHGSNLSLLGRFIKSLLVSERPIEQHGTEIKQSAYNDDDDENYKQQSKRFAVPLQSKVDALILNQEIAANRTKYGLFALQKAAELGHPEAQVLVANSLISGFYPFLVGDGTKANKKNQEREIYPKWFVENKNLTSSNIIPVSDDWLLQSKNPIHTYAMLLWHMAAQHGNVEAALIIADRIASDQLAHPMKQPKNDPAGNRNKRGASKINVKEKMCQIRLPYYAAAAHGIMDQLQASEKSRSIVVPAHDRHILYKVHLHGSSPGKLDRDNKPDERYDALQYYHGKAVELLDNLRVIKGSNGNSPNQQKASTKKRDDDDDSSTDAPIAAHTLAKYYHYGIKGALQNVTLALQYYEAAAYAGHWEAAGQAGTFYLWGIGTKQNFTQAYEVLKRGMPFGYQGCYEKYQLRIQQESLKKHKKDPKFAGYDTSLLDQKIYLCDEIALNGMGLLRLFGVHPHRHLLSKEENQALAINLFRLAREQGSVDAAYNLAMIRLGYKSHFKSIQDLDDEFSKTTTIVDDDVYPLLKGISRSLSMKQDGSVESRDSMDEASMKVSSSSTTLESTKSSSTAHSFDKKSRHFPTMNDYKNILSELTIAASKNHIRANHRLAMMYENGVQIPVTSSTNKRNPKSGMNMQYVVQKDCAKAELHYRWIIEVGSPDINTRMRLAYKLYMNGNTANSLRHYLAVAEMGNVIAQVNAAFLLDQGECLNGLLSPTQCVSAAVRLWKAAAAKGDDPEASLRVGDYYYYGKFRHRQLQNGHNHSPFWGTAGRPFSWVQNIIFPEDVLIPFIAQVVRSTFNSVSNRIYSMFFTPSKAATSNALHNRRQSESVCQDPSSGGHEDGSCSLVDSGDEQLNVRVHDNYHGSVHHNDYSLIQHDLATAARYYRLATDRPANPSPRAHYNLGFMYEWGLGLKQDFPLAKRHYDLAISSASLIKEADVPVSIALKALILHEYIVKLTLSWKNWFEQRRRRISNTVHEPESAPSPKLPLEITSGGEGDSIPAMSERENSGGHPVPGDKKLLHGDMLIHTGNPVLDIILYHLFTFESLVILILTIAVYVLIQLRYARRTHR